MEEFVKQSYLYDFYGDLLTDRQKRVYEAYVLENMSLTEIAQESGISRQGVHDMIRRCNAALEEYEAKLKLVEKFLEVRSMVADIEHTESLEEAKKIAADIIDRL